MRSLIAIVFIILLNCSLPANATLPMSATIDETEVSLGDVVSVQINVTDPNLKDLDFPRENADYQVVANSTSTSLEIVNGVKSQSRVYTFIIRPKHVGAVTLPAIVMRNGTQVVKAGPIDIKVNPAKASTQKTLNTIGNSIRADMAADSKVFAIATINNSSPYVNEQLRLRLKVYHRGNLKSMGVPPPKLDNFVFHSNQEAINYQETYNNKQYFVYEVNYEIFPLKAGLATIPSFDIDAIVLDSAESRQANSFDPLNLFSTMLVEKAIKISTDKITLSVQSLPGGAPKGFTGYVGELAVNNSTSATSVASSDALTITSKFFGNGNVDVLNYARIKDSAQYTVFQDKETVKKQVNKGILFFESGVKVAVMPAKHSGKMIVETLPVISFNPKTKKYEEHGKESFEIIVTPGTNTNADPLKPSPSVNNLETLDYSSEQIISYKPFCLKENYLLWIIFLLNILFFGVKFISRIKFATNNKTGFAYYATAIKKADSIASIAILVKEYINQSGIVVDAGFDTKLKGFFAETDKFIYGIKQDSSAENLERIRNQAMEFLVKIKKGAKRGSK